MKNKFLDKVEEFIERVYIDKNKLKEYLLSGEDIRVYGTKLDGTNFVRDMHKTINGPAGRAMWRTRYWESPYNYMILWSDTDSEFRTIVLRNVEKVRFNNRTYLIK